MLRYSIQRQCHSGSRIGHRVRPASRQRRSRYPTASHHYRKAALQCETLLDAKPNAPSEEVVPPPDAAHIGGTRVLFRTIMRTSAAAKACCCRAIQVIEGP